MEEVVKSEPCPSRASSISAEGESLKNKTWDSKFLVKDSYDIKLNRRVIYRSFSRVFLELNLSNVEDKKLEPNLYNTSRVASDLEGASSSQASESTKEATQKIEGEPTCKKKVAGCLAIWTPAATTLCHDTSTSSCSTRLHYPFEVATNASGIGIGPGLQQDGHRIVYLNKALALKHQTLSTYEKEFLAIMFALEKWKGYLLDSHFIIKTDHYNLKYLLDQRITTPAQMKALPKLKGFDYKVKYKKGVDNVAADALSRVQNKGQLMTTIVVTIPNELFTRIAASFHNFCRVVN
nr:retrovirus-related Pol polyprotein from transposon 17.6 [Tanacetum cinerariifolium]